MRAVVLVGGEGTRLRPLTFTVPKQMLPIVEVPMIERVLGNLARHGITEAVLSLGYRPDAFMSVFPDDTAAGINVSYAVEPEPLDTAGAVAFAARAAGIDEAFVVTNGDVITDLDVTALIEFHRRRGAEATIALAHVSDTSRFGLVRTDGDGRVAAFVEKPSATEASGGTVNAGTYVIEPSVVEAIPAGQRVSIERSVFPSLAARGCLYALASTAYWTDTGTPAQYLQAQLDLISGLRPGPPAPGAEWHEGDVWTMGSAVIDGDVRGPALVGSAAYVEKGAIVEGSVIGSGARVHAGAEVRDSVLLPGSVVRGGARVEGSLVGERAVVGEDAVLSGLTVVGEGVEIPAGSILDGARVPVAG